MSVTTARLSGEKPAPRSRAFAAILAVSIALNICVVAGALWSHANAPPRPPTMTERFHQLAETLDLTPVQRKAFDAYVAATIARSDRLRQDIEPMLDGAWGEIGKPDADQAQVMQLLDQVSDRRRAYQHEMVEATLRLLGGLTPEQRSKFMAAERAYHAAQRRRHASESR